MFSISVSSCTEFPLTCSSSLFPSAQSSLLTCFPSLFLLHRILYAYPSYFTEELVNEIATNPKVCTRTPSSNSPASDPPIARTRPLLLLHARCEQLEGCCRARSLVVLPLTRANNRGSMIHKPSQAKPSVCGFGTSHDWLFTAF